MTTPRPPAFASDPSTRRYYERRAGEYDEWYRGEGRFAGRSRPGWELAVREVVKLLRSLPPARTLDVACGTGYLGRHLHGPVVGVDQSASMVSLARGRLVGRGMIGDALALPVADRAFDRALAGHFYGHLAGKERDRFLEESRRVATELVVVDTARREGVAPEQWQERVLNDGSRHRVYKRFLTAAELASEIGGVPMLDGDWFVVARAEWRS